MARGKKKDDQKVENFIAFEVTGKHDNNFEGRIYKEPHTVEGKGSWHGVSITINGLTVKGVKLWIPVDEAKAVCFLWPSYKSKDGKNESYIAFFNEDDREDVAALADKLAGDLGY